MGGSLLGTTHEAPISGGGCAHPLILERRNGLARRIYNCHAADDRFPVRQAPSEVQKSLITDISAGGYSANQLVFGSSPVDLFGWDERDGDLLFAQDTSSSGHFAQLWKLGKLAQEACPEGVAKSKLRRFPAYSNPFNSTDVKIGDSALFQKVVNRKSAPR